MEVKTGNSSNGFTPEINLEKLHKMAAEVILLGKFILRLLDAALVFVTNVLARFLGSKLVRRHFHLMLSALVLFGPVLSFWVSKYSIFANSNHYLYRYSCVSAFEWKSQIYNLLLLLEMKQNGCMIFSWTCIINACIICYNEQPAIIEYYET